MKIGIFTALFGDWPLHEAASHVADLGYEAVELPAWAGNKHLDLAQVLAGDGAKTRKLLADRGLSISAINNGIAGQLTMGPHDSSTDTWAPGMSPEEKIAFARTEILRTAQAASELEVPIVTGLIGSHVWDKWYIFPPANEKLYEEGVQRFAERWNPILDDFKRY
ncbi:MAG: TIM barrel protein, partial [Verrucomicrobia bacterium]|nr:TIM barrel protein [Verrucomicrobiota bacterium]